MLFRFVSRQASEPLPEKIGLLVREARWLILAAVGAYVAMILIGYDKADPGWSHAVAPGRVMNPGGRFGAWFADMLLSFLGSSAWWLVVFLFWGLFFGGRRLRDELAGDRRSFFIVMAGFAIVLLASSGIEALRFYSSTASLPGAPGGVIGLEIGDMSMRYLGFTGGTLLLLTLWSVGLSIFGGFSWVVAAEKLGYALEASVLWCHAQYQARQDRRLGQELAGQREEKVKRERKKREDKPPVSIHIEPVKMEIAKSERVAKESQQSLFGESATGGLPPLSLLDSLQRCRAAFSGFARIHLASYRTQARRFWRRGESAGGLSWPGDYAV